MIVTLIFTVFLVSVVNCISPSNTTETTAIVTEATTHKGTIQPTSVVQPTSHVPATTSHPTHNSTYWVVYYDETSNRFCIIMDAAIVMKLSTESESRWIEIGRDYHANATATGMCSTVENYITLMYDVVKLTLTFSRSKPADTHYSMSRIELWYNGSCELNATKIPSWLNNIDNTRDYTCNKNQTIFNDLNEYNKTVMITISQLKLEVFQNTTTDHPEFSASATSCDTTDNLIPIIVGAALGGLIIIVLIAYLVGRHRSRRGYESV